MTTARTVDERKDGRIPTRYRMPFGLEDAAAIEVGDWVPVDASGAALSFAGATGRYFKIGPMVVLIWEIPYPVTASGATAKIGGLPFVPRSGVIARFSGVAGFVQGGSAITYELVPGGTFLQPFTNGQTIRTNANLSNAIVTGMLIYETDA